MFSYILDYYTNTKVEVLKLSTSFVVMYNYLSLVTLNTNVNTNIEFLGNIFKIENILSLGNWKPIFEKNLYICQTNFMELYSYNLQLLIQLSGLLLYFLLFLPISFFKKHNVYAIYIFF